MPLRIGLDFGTSSVKAAYRTEGERNDRTIPLKLVRSKGIEGFILNGALRIDSGSLAFDSNRRIGDLSWKRCLSCVYDGNLTCGAERGNCPLTKAISNEDLLAGMDLAQAAQFLASVYLGFILSRVDEAVRKDIGQRFGADDYRCFVHMCVPVGELQNDLCRLVFQDALTLADQMYGLGIFANGCVDVASALAAWKDCERLEILTEERRRGRVFPEVTAEIASYAKSKAAKEGTYALVDIGAGTVDINVFRWVPPTSGAGTGTPVFAAYCDGTGVLALEERLLEILGEWQSPALIKFEEQKQAKRFPSIPDLSRLASTQELRAGVADALQLAFSDFCGALGTNGRKTWGAARRKKGKEDWRSLGVFIGGGGSAIEGLKQPLTNGIENELISKLTVKKLPVPSEDELERVRGFPVSEFHRLSVAYGLTVANDFEDGMKWPQDIPDAPPPKIDFLHSSYEDRFVGKEQV